MKSIYQNILSHWRALPLLLLVGSVGCDGEPSGAASRDVRRDATVVAIERAMPCVVNIATSVLVRRNDTPAEVMRRRFFGLSDGPAVSEKVNSVGSGVIIDAVGEEGFILTNLHVVEDAVRVQVQLSDGRVYDAERLLRTSIKDLALLRIVRKPDQKPFMPATLAKDDDLLLGETVIAIGNPFGLGGSVSRGILSSKNRRAFSGDKPLRYEDWLQTDADINPGNSGGALINLRGELIGMNVAIYEAGQGQGASFAIPIKQISAALSDFFSLEFTSDRWLGARLKGPPYPLTVLEVQAKSPADRAGLRVGQEVIAVNGQPVKSLVAFNVLMAASVSNKAEVIVKESGSRKTLRVEMLPMAVLNQQLLQLRLGLKTRALTVQEAAGFQINPKDALLITEVQSNSPAAGAQLEPGLFLTGLGNVGVSDRVSLSIILGNKSSGEIIPLNLALPTPAGLGEKRLQATMVNVPLR